MRRRGSAIVALRAPAAPPPGVAGPSEADFAHQLVDRRRIEADRGRQRDVDRVVAPGRPTRYLQSLGVRDGGGLHLHFLSWMSQRDFDELLDWLTREHEQQRG